MDLAVTSKKMSNFIACHHGLTYVHMIIMAQIQMHGHTSGTSMVLLITEKVLFVVEQRILPSAHVTHTHGRVSERKC